MGTFTVLTGIACGLLAGAAGLSFLDGSRAGANRREAMLAISAAAVALLMIAGGIALWEQCGHAVSSGRSWWAGACNALAGRPLRLVFMAATAALPWKSTGRRRPPRDTLLLIPSLLGAAAAFLLAPESGLATLEPVSGSATIAGCLRGLAVVACSAIGARAMAGGLEVLCCSEGIDLHTTSATAAYALLTVVVGETALAGLLLRGVPWGLATDEAPLAAAWIAWSAAWFGQQYRALPRAGLSVLGSGLLVLAALL
jgi:hypothetical protein